MPTIEGWKDWMSARMVAICWGKLRRWRVRERVKMRARGVERTGTFAVPSQTWTFAVRSRTWTFAVRSQPVRSQTWTFAVRSQPGTFAVRSQPVRSQTRTVAVRSQPVRSQTWTFAVRSQTGTFAVRLRTGTFAVRGGVSGLPWKRKPVQMAVKSPPSDRKGTRLNSSHIP